MDQLLVDSFLYTLFTRQGIAYLNDLITIKLHLFKAAQQPKVETNILVKPSGPENPQLSAIVFISSSRRNSHRGGGDGKSHANTGASAGSCSGGGGGCGSGDEGSGSTLIRALGTRPLIHGAWNKFGPIMELSNKFRAKGHEQHAAGNLVRVSIRDLRRFLAGYGTEAGVAMFQTKVKDKLQSSYIYIYGCTRQNRIYSHIGIYKVI